MNLKPTEQMNAEELYGELRLYGIEDSVVAELMKMFPEEQPSLTSFPIYGADDPPEE